MNKSSILQGTMTILAFLLCSLFFVFSEVANAAFTDDCDTELNAVEAAIIGATFTNSRDSTNLLSKLNAACAKINLDKLDGAMDKLENISDKANNLVDPPGGKKSKLVDATDINEAVDAAITCVATLEGDTACSPSP